MASNIQYGGIFQKISKMIPFSESEIYILVAGYNTFLIKLHEFLTFFKMTSKVQYGGGTKTP